MFLDVQPKAKTEYYQEMLQAIGSLSRLFSESNEPYIAYRIAENLFCKSFDAKNLSRTDCSVDASYGKLGIGVKTFLEKNGATMQKIAEFNGDHNLFAGLAPTQKVKKIAELRNERLETTKRIFGLDNLIYHCITRREGAVLVYETKMGLIDLGAISGLSERGGIVNFRDGIDEYQFNTSKSTLYKRFLTEDVLLNFPVKILLDPFDELAKIVARVQPAITFAPIRSYPSVFLPLYSSRGGSKEVPPKSGLNLWNAAGRARDFNEIYIPIPAWLHRTHPDFFPERDQPFDLILPNGKVMSTKICQDGDKALMSNPNSALGQWLLRDVLNLSEGQLLVYRKLEEIGLDSVVIYKTEEGKYAIDFTRIGSYEKFREENVVSEEDETD